MCFHYYLKIKAIAFSFNYNINMKRCQFHMRSWSTMPSRQGTLFLVFFPSLFHTQYSLRMVRRVLSVLSLVIWKLKWMTQGKILNLVVNSYNSFVRHVTGSYRKKCMQTMKMHKSSALGCHPTHVWSMGPWTIVHTYLIHHATVAHYYKKKCQLTFRWFNLLCICSVGKLSNLKYI